MTNSALPTARPDTDRHPLWKRSLMAATVCYGTALLTATHLPATLLSGSPVLDLDKLLHFLSYCGLGGLAVLAAGVRRVRGSGYLRWGLLLAAFAAVDEFSQFLAPGRQPDFGDWLADLAGLAAGFAAGAFLLRLWRGTAGRRLLRASEIA